MWLRQFRFDVVEGRVPVPVAHLTVRGRDGVWVSVPFMDQRSVERRPAYAAHMKKVSALLPLPPRR